MRRHTVALIALMLAVLFPRSATQAMRESIHRLRLPCTGQLTLVARARMLVMARPNTAYAPGSVAAPTLACAVDLRSDRVRWVRSLSPGISGAVPAPDARQVIMTVQQVQQNALTSPPPHAPHGALLFLDVRRGQVAATLKLPGQPVAIAIDGPGCLAFVAIQATWNPLGRGSVAIIDACHPRLLSIIPTPIAPDRVATDPTRERLVVDVPARGLLFYTAAAHPRLVWTEALPPLQVNSLAVDPVSGHTIAGLSAGGYTPSQTGLLDTRSGHGRAVVAYGTTEGIALDDRYPAAILYDITDGTFAVLDTLHGRLRAAFGAPGRHDYEDWTTLDAVIDDRTGHALVWTAHRNLNVSSGLETSVVRRRVVDLHTGRMLQDGKVPSAPEIGGALYDTAARRTYTLTGQNLDLSGDF